MSKKENCYRCRHYHVTWDANYPRGCRALNFKTKFFPSDVVRSSSGMSCLYFTEKHKPGKGSGERHDKKTEITPVGRRAYRRKIKYRIRGREVQK